MNQLLVVRRVCQVSDLYGLLTHSLGRSEVHLPRTDGLLGSWQLLYLESRLSSPSFRDALSCPVRRNMEPPTCAYTAHPCSGLIHAEADGNVDCRAR